LAQTIASGHVERARITCLDGHAMGVTVERVLRPTPGLDFGPGAASVVRNHEPALLDAYVERVRLSRMERDILDVGCARRHQWQAHCRRHARTLRLDAAQVVSGNLPFVQTYQ